METFFFVASGTSPLSNNSLFYSSHWKEILDLKLSEKERGQDEVVSGTKTFLRRQRRFLWDDFQFVQWRDGENLRKKGRGDLWGSIFVLGNLQAFNCVFSNLLIAKMIVLSSLKLFLLWLKFQKSFEKSFKIL